MIDPRCIHMIAIWMGHHHEKLYDYPSQYRPPYFGVNFRLHLSNAAVIVPCVIMSHTPSFLDFTDSFFWVLTSSSFD